VKNKIKNLTQARCLEIGGNRDAQHNRARIQGLFLLALVIEVQKQNRNNTQQSKLKSNR